MNNTSEVYFQLAHSCNAEKTTILLFLWSGGMSGNASFIILYRVCLREARTGDRKRERRGFVIVIQLHTDRGVKDTNHARGMFHIATWFRQVSQDVLHDVSLFRSKHVEFLSGSPRSHLLCPVWAWKAGLFSVWAGGLVKGWWAQRAGAPHIPNREQDSRPFQMI